MTDCGFLILTSPARHILRNIPGIIASACSHTKGTLYLHLAPGLHVVGTEPPPIQVLPWTNISKSLITQLYSAASKQNPSLDMRILLTNITNTDQPQIYSHHLRQPCKIILAEPGTTKDSLLQYIMHHFTANTLDGINFDAMQFSHLSKDAMQENDDSTVVNEKTLKSFGHVCLGGTFDNIHTGHKILLSEACLTADQRLVVGVTDMCMTKNKTLCELVKPVDLRIAAVQNLLLDLKPSLTYEIVPIPDPFGPSIVDPDIECLVVSEETQRGGNKVNEKRREKGLSLLDLDVIGLVEDSGRGEEEELKLSSSSLRRRMLGSLLKPVEPRPGLPPRPYLIGLVGGIASGKSSVSKRLSALGAGSVDCDKLAHKVYEPGQPAHEQLLAAFGADILGEDNVIDRKKLGPKVFNNEEAMSTLKAITWPATKDLALQEAHQLHSKGCEVVLIEAALLLEAGWADEMHEVWTTLIPEAEAVVRMKERDGMEEEAAVKRIHAQMSNQGRVDVANVVLCTLWDPSVTQKQVEKAWALLLERIK